MSDDEFEEEASSSSTTTNSRRTSSTTTSRDDLDDDDADDVDVLDDELEIADEVPVPVVTDDTATPRPPSDEDDDDDVLDLDEELHPDDVEEPLDVLLQERTASATLEDDEEEVEDDEVDVDERGDGPTRIVPRRADEFLCKSCFLRAPAPAARRRGTPVLRRLRLTAASAPASSSAFASGLLAGLCFPPYGLGLLVVVALVPLLWTWRDARPRHAALYGFAWGVGCYAVTWCGSATSACVAFVAARRSRWRPTSRSRARSSGSLASAGRALAAPHRGGLGR